MNQYWDIEADWNLDLFCNYHCTYCISRSNKVPILGQEYLNKIFHFFSSRKLKWHLHFTGGEPFHYPNQNHNNCSLVRRLSAASRSA